MQRTPCFILEARLGVTGWRAGFLVLISLAIALVSLPSALSGQTSATVTVAVNQPGAVVSSNLFGIFFEEINYAGEGGIYAEMVRNRAFYDPAAADFWTYTTTGSATGSMNVDSATPLNTNIPNSLRVTMTSGSGTVAAVNNGFFGMNVSNGAAYGLSLYAKATNGFTGPITVQLQGAASGTVYAHAAFDGFAGSWQKFTTTLIPSATDTNAQLSLSISNQGTVWLDMVSLFPQATYNNRTNGLRGDLAGMLATNKPSFMRFPGGNFVESYNVGNAVRWKSSIGDIALRPGHMNDAWGYWSTDGYGVDEAFHQCEDMGMQLLYGIYAGLSLGYNGSTNNTVPLDEMGPYVQDALDLIQYANGATNTPWGALRAANGHPAPYNLQFMEVGNENGGSYYNDRYALFYNAIKSNYPNMHLIAPDWGGIPTSAPVEIQDEHYYSDPGTFISYATKYDSYSRGGPRVFVGEYAVTSGYGTYGNLSAALGEASFMTGMERNSDLVLMASYAPLFGNVNGLQWHPDLIYFNDAQAFGTPSYYVQRMFSQNRGDVVLPSTVNVTANPSNYVGRGSIGVGSWNTSVQYSNIVVTSNGTTLYQSDFVHQNTNGWNVFNGTWGVSSGSYQQSAQITDCYSLYSNSTATNWANYTVSLQACKTGGSEGFLILFNALDNSDWTWWNVGGWGNTLDGIEQSVDGLKTTYAQVPQNIQQNTWYYIRIVVTGLRAQCYLGTSASQAATNLVQDVTLPVPQGGLFASSTYSRANGQVIIKAVNPYGQPVVTTFNLAGATSIASNGAMIQLTSAAATDENSFAAPTQVAPTTQSFGVTGSSLTMTLPANSLSVLQIGAAGLSSYSNLTLQCPAVITNGTAVASSVLAQQSGGWINLTTNTNHAIGWSSANSNVAAVDYAGNVTGLSPGTTTITASYPALGLVAQQSVQVVYLPATLVHRYSFSETNGSQTAADSIGGAAWTGTLPNGGTFSGSGQLSFASSASQFLNLPGGILSNFSETTIDMWIPSLAGSNTSPPFAYLFSFGNTDSSGNGYNYIFFNPNLARATISGADPGYNGEQGGNLAASLGTATNLHLTCVFDNPAGVINVYTNGALASAFYGITDPLSVVGNQFAYIGRSLYTADSYLTWTIDELRIYNGALSATEVAASDALGPGQLLATGSPRVSAVASAQGVTLSWPLASAGYTVMMTTNLAAGGWTPAGAAPAIVGGLWQVNIPITNGAQYFQLTK